LLGTITIWEMVRLHSVVMTDQVTNNDPPVVSFMLMERGMLRTTTIPPSTSAEQTLPSKSSILPVDWHRKTPHPLPLKPPFRIVQLGRRRTGSTFQLHLLDAIAQVKTGAYHATHGINFQYISQDKRIGDTYVDFGESFVVKSHRFREKRLEDLQKEGRMVLFTSGMREDEDDIFNYTLYNQDPEALRTCSLCEVDHYRDIFGLTDGEVTTIKDYLRSFEQIRQCCGLQMSQYEIARLNGCNMTEPSQRPEYPHCESLDKEQAERDLSQSPIRHRSQTVEYNWEKPGDCARFDAIVRSGRGRNNRPFDASKDCPT